MLITDDFSWDFDLFERYVEALRPQVVLHAFERVPFLASLTPLTILTFFAIWKEGKIACPLNSRLPALDSYLEELGSPLFIPSMPQAPALFASTSPLRKEAIATLLYTSGSSGRPKMACHTFKNHLKSAEGSLVKIPLDDKSVWGLSLPLHHVGGLSILFRCYQSQASILLSSNLSKATHLSVVPTQLYRMLRQKTEFPCLRYLLLGGAPLFPYENTPWNVLPTYGMTEMSSQIVTDHTLHPFAEMKIDTDREIWVKGDVLFKGYFRKDGPFDPAVDAEGWFRTGDLGEWRRGKFHVVGRKDNLFICGGENIQPEEIEKIVQSIFPEENCIVVPLADEEYGAKPVIFLNSPCLLPQIQQKLKEVLPKFKIPIQAFQMPHYEGLKPSRSALKDIANKSKNLK